MTLQLIIWKNVLDIGWLLFLSLVFRYFWLRRQETVKAKHWVKARGRITQCEWLINDKHIWPKVEYSYQVGDRDFTCEHIFLDTTHNVPYSKPARLLAYKIVTAFQENADIDVYYNPEHPMQAVLDTTVPRKLNVILCIIAALIVLHLGVMSERLFASLV